MGFDLVVLSGDVVGCVADLGWFGDFLVIWVLGLLRGVGCLRSGLDVAIGWWCVFLGWVRMV